MASLTFANITRAAIEQDWSVEQTSKQHRRMIPPDKSQPIVIGAGTTGDPKAVHHFLSQMRQSGFTWPWPPQPQREDTSDDDEQLSGYQMRVSQSDELSDELNDDDELSDDDDEIQDQWIPVVADRPLVPGYMMNIEGAVRSPSGRVLTPELKGRQLWILFKVADEATGFVMKRSRLDKVVLWTWVGEPVNSDAQPVHINGDLLDCRPDNLRWPCAVKPWRDESVESEEVSEEAVEDQDVYGQSAAMSGANGSAAFTEAYRESAERSTERVVARKHDVSDDDISVKFVLSNHGIDLVGKFTATGAFGDYSLITPSGRLDGLSGDDLRVLAAMIARWRKVADELS